MTTFDNFEDYLDSFEEGKNNSDDDIYLMANNKLIVYILKVEDDMKKKHGIDIMYESSSNYKFNMMFYMNNNITFEKVRTIQKYFYDNIPFVIKVEMDNNGFIIVQLSRAYGLDSLDTKITH